MKVQEQANDDWKDLAQRLKDQPVAMMSLLDAEGRMASRPLTAVQIDSQGQVWFMVSRKAMSHLFAQGAEPVNLSFANGQDSTYVSVAGLGQLHQDLSLKVKLWSMMARPWFSGADDPDLTLLCVTPQQVDIWDGPDNGAVRALAMLASVVAAEPVGLGDHQTLSNPKAVHST